MSLWDEYVQEARRHMRALEDRAIELRFDDLEDGPATVPSESTSFCHLEADPNRIGEVAKLLRRNRAYAYRSGVELEPFARDLAQRLLPYGS
jgi:hypothetical protein